MTARLEQAAHDEPHDCLRARGDTGARVTGDILATRLKYRGAAGLITDGAIGDLAAMQEVGLAEAYPLSESLRAEYEAAKAVEDSLESY